MCSVVSREGRGAEAESEDELEGFSGGGGGALAFEDLRALVGEEADAEVVLVVAADEGAFGDLLSELLCFGGCGLSFCLVFEVMGAVTPSRSRIRPRIARCRGAG